MLLISVTDNQNIKAGWRNEGTDEIHIP